MKFIIILIAVVVGVLIYDSARVYLLIKKSAALIESIKPFSRAAKGSSDTPGQSMRILVVGDSTAYGTGTTDVNFSTAGRLAALYPNAEVVNLAINGLKIQGLLNIFDKLPVNEHFDIVLIQIGANDIIRLTPMTDIASGIKKVLDRAEQFGGKVVVLHSGNVGDAPFWPWYVGAVLASRSYEVQGIYKNEVALRDENKVRYADIIAAPADKILKNDPDTYYSADKLHLNEAGYGIWFDVVKKELDAFK